jgi:hypothetical protein
LQIDHRLRKRRPVRRTLMAPAERDRRLSTGSYVPDDGEDTECSMCLSTYAETPTIEVVRLGCGHKFHCLCVQHIADAKGQCPLCRAEVDWKSILP